MDDTAMRSNAKRSHPSEPGTGHCHPPFPVPRLAMDSDKEVCGGSGSPPLAMPSKASSRACASVCRRIPSRPEPPSAGSRRRLPATPRRVAARSPSRSMRLSLMESPAKRCSRTLHDALERRKTEVPFNRAVGSEDWDGSVEPPAVAESCRRRVPGTSAAHSTDSSWSPSPTRDDSFRKKSQRRSLMAWGSGGVEARPVAESVASTRAVTRFTAATAPTSAALNALYSSSPSLRGSPPGARSTTAWS
mmetsp:Transcript_21090/g.61550  ORF Transcript_21090/g.61550 Transcript_21090/m.61550 type:complete len:247 (+) Transcript_21090:994-1734(+)